MGAAPHRPKIVTNNKTPIEWEINSHFRLKIILFIIFHSRFSIWYTYFMLLVVTINKYIDLLYRYNLIYIHRHFNIFRIWTNSWFRPENVYIVRWYTECGVWYYTKNEINIFWVSRLWLILIHSACELFGVFASMRRRCVVFTIFFLFVKEQEENWCVQRIQCWWWWYWRRIGICLRDDDEIQKKRKEKREKVSTGCHRICETGWNALIYLSTLWCRFSIETDMDPTHISMNLHILWGVLEDAWSFFFKLIRKFVFWTLICDQLSIQIRLLLSGLYKSPVFARKVVNWDKISVFFSIWYYQIIKWIKSSMSVKVK